MLPRLKRVAAPFSILGFLPLPLFEDEHGQPAVHPVASECELQIPTYKLPEGLQHAPNGQILAQDSPNGPAPVRLPRKHHRHCVPGGKVVFACIELCQLDCGVEDLLDFRPVGLVHELGLEQPCNAASVPLPFLLKADIESLLF